MSGETAIQRTLIHAAQLCWFRAQSLEEPLPERLDWFGLEEYLGPRFASPVDFGRMGPGPNGRAYLMIRDRFEDLGITVEHLKWHAYKCPKCLELSDREWGVEWVTAEGGAH